MGIAPSGRLPLWRINALSSSLSFNETRTRVSQSRDKFQYMLHVYHSYAVAFRSVTITNSCKHNVLHRISVMEKSLTIRSLSLLQANSRQLGSFILYKGDIISLATWEHRLLHVVLERLQILEISSRFEISRPVSSAGSRGSRAMPTHRPLTSLAPPAVHKAHHSSTNVSGLSRARRTHYDASQMWRVEGVSAKNTR